MYYNKLCFKVCFRRTVHLKFTLKVCNLISFSTCMNPQNLHKKMAISFTRSQIPWAASQPVLPAPSCLDRGSLYIITTRWFAALTIIQMELHGTESSLASSFHSA